MIYCDYGGVLSDSEFFHRHREPGQPLAGQLDRGMHRIWHEIPEVSRSWSLGQMTFDQVTDEMGLDGIDPGYLLAALKADARQMPVHAGIADLLPEMKRYAGLVLATDNAAEFAQAFDDARRDGLHARRPRDGGPAVMENVAPWFDGVLCSSGVRALKAEDPGAFFSAHLSASGCDWGRMLLIDDRPGNCDAVRRAGGAAVHWSLSDSTEDLAKAVSDWVAQCGGQAASTSDC